MSSVTRLRYEKMKNDFEVWSQQHSHPDMFDALEAYLDALYLNGEDLSIGTYTVAAITHLSPELKMDPRMAKIQQSLKGWRRLSPPRSRMPLPFEAVALVALTAIKDGLVQLALAMLLTFVLYLRPTEFELMRVADIVRPVPGGRAVYKYWSVLLHPLEEGVPSKTQQWDESLTLDLPHMEQLGPAMSRVLKLQTRAKDELAFNVTSKEINDYLVAQWEPLKLTGLGAPHMYRLRHGGATHELANHLRALQEVQLRGRWMSVKSLKNYEKGGRLAQLFGNLPKSVQKKCIHATKQLKVELRRLR